jgi:hypothetical protein
MKRLLQRVLLWLQARRDSRAPIIVIEEWIGPDTVRITTMQGSRRVTTNVLVWPREKADRLQRMALRGNLGEDS